jgi:hypothetical protein
MSLPLGGGSNSLGTAEFFSSDVRIQFSRIERLLNPVSRLVDFQ